MTRKRGGVSSLFFTPHMRIFGLPAMSATTLQYAPRLAINSPVTQLVQSALVNAVRFTYWYVSKSYCPRSSHRWPSTLLYIPIFCPAVSWIPHIPTNLIFLRCCRSVELIGKYESHSAHLVAYHCWATTSVVSQRVRPAIVNRNSGTYW